MPGPPPANAPVHYGTLAIENCRFVSPPDAEFALITPMEPLGTTKAIILRTIEGERDVFLSATGISVADAVYKLHARSADAAQNYISLHGYARAPGSTKTASKSGPSDSSDQPVEVFDNDGFSSSGCETLSDDETVSIISGRGEKRVKHKNRKQHKHKDNGRASNARQSRSRSRSRSRSSVRSGCRSGSGSRSSSVDSELDTPRGGRPYQAPNNALPSSARAVNHPLPGPVFTSPAGGFVSPAGFRCSPGFPGARRMSPVSGASGGALPRATAPPPPAPVPSMMPSRLQPTTPSFHHDVLIRIHWLGRGYAQVMKRLVPNQSILNATAQNYVRRNPGMFNGAQPSDINALKMPMGSPGSLGLLAQLRSVVIAGDQIDLRSYQGDNLSTLVQEAHDARAGLPKFEIDVQTTPPVPRGCMGIAPARPTSTGPVSV